MRDLPLAGHLRELRARVLVALVPFVVSMIWGLIRSDALVAMILRSAVGQGVPLYAYGIADGALLRVRAAFAAALAVAAPFAAFQAVAFAKPGMTVRETRAVALLAVGGGCAFAIGATVFTLFLAPWLAQWWYAASDASRVMLDASRLLGMWETGLVLCAALVALPFVPAFWWMMRRATRVKGDQGRDKT